MKTKVDTYLRLCLLTIIQDIELSKHHREAMFYYFHSKCSERTLRMKLNLFKGFRDLRSPLYSRAKLHRMFARVWDVSRVKIKSESRSPFCNLLFRYGDVKAHRRDSWYSDCAVEYTYARAIEARDHDDRARKNFNCWYLDNEASGCTMGKQPFDLLARSISFVVRYGKHDFMVRNTFYYSIHSP